MRRHENYTATQVILPPPQKETAKEPLPKPIEEVVEKVAVDSADIEETADDFEETDDSAKEEIITHKRRK